MSQINKIGIIGAGNMAEGIVEGATFDHDAAVDSGRAAPASGTRRTRLLEGVGFDAD